MKSTALPVISFPPSTIARVSWPHILLGMVGAGVSLYTVKLHRLAQAGLDTGCGISSTFSCDEVLGSPRWGQFLGLPLGFYGAAFFAIVVLTAISTGPEFNARSVALQRLGVASIGVLTSLALEWVMWKIIGKGCLFCMATHALTLLNFGWALWQWKKVKSAPKITTPVPMAPAKD